MAGRAATNVKTCDACIDTADSALGPNRLILVIDASETEASALKGLIEFMDAPDVRVAEADSWLEVLSDRRLAAVFMGSNLPGQTVSRLIAEIGELDRNVPIVLVDADDTA